MKDRALIEISPEALQLALSMLEDIPDGYFHIASQEFYLYLSKHMAGMEFLKDSLLKTEDSSQRSLMLQASKAISDISFEKLAKEVLAQ